MEMNIPSRVLESPTPLSAKSLQGTLVGRESLHGWQSSYAMDCRSMDPGANPGPCSTSQLVTTLEFDDTGVDVTT